MQIDTEISTPTTPEEISAARQRIVESARAWLRTPYHQCWQKRGVGCDCASLLAGVYADAGIIPPQELGSYDWSAPWAKKGADEIYLAGIRKFAHPISPVRVSAGDVAMYKLGRGWSHTAIVIRWPGEVVHALMGQGVVATPGNSGRLAGRAVRFWSFF